MLAKMATKQFSKRGAEARGISDDAPAEASGSPAPCGPCRGTGKLLSTAATSAALGELHTVSCPWCEGTAVTIPDHDAQEHPAETPPVLTEAELEERKAALAARETKPRARKAPAKKPAAKKATAKKAPAKKAAAKKPAAE